MINTTNGIANLKQQQQQPTTTTATQIINAIPIQTTTTPANTAQIATAISVPTATSQVEGAAETPSAQTNEPVPLPTESESQEPAKENAAASLQQTLVSLVNNMNEAAESGSDALASLSTSSGVPKASSSMERLNEVINV